MPESSYLARGRVRRLLPMVTSILLLEGCGGGSSDTAAFPELGKKAIITKAPAKKPEKGMDRVGSETAAP
jgi:hypothetical protein